jgi:hypothetical protein
MSERRIAVVQAGLLLVALAANAAVRNNHIRIRVLDSETHSVSLDEAGTPRNCDSVNFDVDYHNSKTTQLANRLLVQQGNESPYRITCTVETKWSSCVALPQGRSFEARRNKRGLIVFYADAKGKGRKQLYARVVPEDANPAQPAAPIAAPVSSAPRPGFTEEKAQAPVPATSAIRAEEAVKCSFTSTPSGAEVSVDGRYVGSTPSLLNLSVGNHAVEVSLPGFAPWKRGLTVSTGSELTANAVLQKSE